MRVTSRPFFLTENNAVFWFCLAALAGPALSSLFGGDVNQFPDAHSYLGLAQGDFDQTTVRRYRVLIPFAAAALDQAFGGIFERLRPGYYAGDFSLPFCFFLVNTALMAIFCTLVYRFCRTFNCSRPAALVGVVAVITSRYTVYFAALPLIDSLVCVVTAMVLLGIRTDNKRMLVLCIFLGPLARESFLFVAPLVLLFGNIPISKQLLLFMLSGLLSSALRLAMDHFFPPTTPYWLKADLQHLHNLRVYLPLLFSPYGLYKIFVNMGLWIFVPLFALYASGNFVRHAFKDFTGCAWLFLISVLIQMLLSGSMERMFYQALILFAAIVALAIDALRKKTFPEKNPSS